MPSFTLSLQVHVSLRDHISLRTRKSLLPSHLSGAPTSSQNIHLGTCLRNASPMFATALSQMAVYVSQSSRQDAAQAAQHGRHALEGARLQLWRSARPAQAGKLTSSFDYEWYIIAAFVVKSPTPIKNDGCRQNGLRGT